MPATGLFFLPAAPNATVSPLPNLISHLSSKFPHLSQLGPPHVVDHRLFVSTSSLLPAPNKPQDIPNDALQRKYTQFLTFPADATDSATTHVGTTNTSTAAGAMDIIAIPARATEDFATLMSKKMEPLWAFRAATQVSGGMAFELPRAGGDWRVRVGDVRVTAGQGAGRVRGTLIELEWTAELNEEVPAGNQGAEAPEAVVWDARETILRAAFERLLAGSEIPTDDARVVVKVPEPVHPPTGVGLLASDGKASDEEDPLLLLRVRQHMELLRFARA